MLLSKGVVYGLDGLDGGIFHREGRVFLLKATFSVLEASK